MGVVYLVALPIAALAGPAAFLRLLEVERALVNALLGARIPAPPPVTPETTVGRAQVAFLAEKFPISVLAAGFCALPAALFVELLVRAEQGLVGSSWYLGPWPLQTVAGVVLLLLAVPALILSVGALGGTARLISRVSRRGLASPVVAGVPVREVLAERLGDRTLAIAYWLPERGLFVDEHGHRSRFPNRARRRLGPLSSIAVAELRRSSTMPSCMRVRNWSRPRPPERCSRSTTSD